MTLRRRLTLMSAVVVGVILAGGSVLCFVVMRGQLRGEIDALLREQARLVQQVAARRPELPATIPRPRKGSGSAPFGQFIGSDGSTVTLGDLRLPVSREDLEVARGRRAQVMSDRTVAGEHVRVITVRVARGGAVQLGRSMGTVDSALGRLRFVLAMLTAGGLVLAATASRLFARPVLAPIEELTSATEHIEATGDLRRRVDDQRGDEVGRLASSFNAMLDQLESSQAALAASAAAQRQLVADASHELRTPVASLRTNVEVLLSSEDIEAESRRGLLADIVEQTEELTSVVSDLIDLARGEQQVADVEDLDLAELARAALSRAERHAPQLHYDSDLQPWPMTGARDLLSRAINNVLDNAAKFAPPDSTVRVRLSDGVLTVADEGPGVAAADLPHLFNRFFRTRDAGRHQGSGLGLAIVQQIAESHGGTVTATRADGGGLQVTMRFDQTVRSASVGDSLAARIDG